VPVRLLLSGRPGVGKTTVAARLLDELRRAGLPSAGFVTGEIREGGRRVGFSVADADGNRGVLAHVELPGPPRVGRYGVDVQTFERVALPALQRAERAGVVVIDEIGKMELASEPFREALERLLEEPVDLVATVHVFAHPFTEALRRRPDVEVESVTTANRDALPSRLLERLRPGSARRGPAGETDGP
jgi:nucleoside-triphosphatase